MEVTGFKICCNFFNQVLEMQCGAAGEEHHLNISVRSETLLGNKKPNPEQ
jgi:hypothetical protein